jgi:hypothetical protein
MKNPVIGLSEILHYINNRIAFIREQKTNIDLTCQDLIDTIDPSSKKNNAAELLQLEYKKYFLNGRVEELKELSQEMINLLGQLALENKDA